MIPESLPVYFQSFMTIIMLTNKHAVDQNNTSNRRNNSWTLLVMCDQVNPLTGTLELQDNVQQYGDWYTGR